MLKLLLDRGANVNITDEQGNTALITVLTQELDVEDDENYFFFRDSPVFYKCVKLLLDYGLDPEIANNYNETAFDCVWAYSDFAKLFKQYISIKPILK